MPPRLHTLTAWLTVAACAPVTRPTTAAPVVEETPTAPSDVVVVAEPPATRSGMVAGIVSTSEPGHARIAGARLVLQCTCLPTPLETVSDNHGEYRFVELGPGAYSLDVFVGRANVAKLFDLPPAGELRAHFRVDPNRERRIVVRVKWGRPSFALPPVPGELP